MDDIDRELKLVQLKRERLALERELAIRDAGSSVKHVAGAIAGGVAALSKAAGALLEAIGSGVERWWKVLMTLFVVAVSIGAGLYWQEQRVLAAQERWQAAREVFASKKCPAPQCNPRSVHPLDGDGAFNCLQMKSEQQICLYGAMADYAGRVPRP